MPLRSMTGYGRGTCEVAGRRLVVELRSLNHRFLEVKLRLPWVDAALEMSLTQLLRGRLDRGVVTVNVREEGGAQATAPQAVRVDVELGRAFARALTELREAIGLVEPVGLALVAAQPGVLQAGEALPDSERLWAALKPGVEAAVGELVESRAREGAAIAADLKARLVTLTAITAELHELSRETPEQYRQRLLARLERFLGEHAAVDAARVAQEVAILADRLDVTEELTRLQAHLAEMNRLLDDGGPAGRRLDFLTQEINREVNTIGSKSQSAPCAARVIDAKAELEKLREQIQNVE